MNYLLPTMKGCDLQIAAQFINYLKERGVSFSNDGFPVFDTKWFLTFEPDEILPFCHRSVCKNEAKTAICFNERDDELYIRIKSVFKDLPIYQKFMGVMAMDVSVSRFMLKEAQRFNLLLNALFLAVLGVNGVKFAAPIRYGAPDTIPYFIHYRGSSFWSVGCVGTRSNKLSSKTYEEYTRRAFLLVMDRPNKLLAYGLMDESEKDDWEVNNVPVRVYQDFNERSRRGDLSYVR